MLAHQRGIHCVHLHKDLSTLNFECLALTISIGLVPFLIDQKSKELLNYKYRKWKAITCSMQKQK